MDEKRELEMIDTAYEEERDRVEEEWKRGRDMIRKRLLEGIEERRRRAREEKDGEGNVGGSCIHRFPLDWSHRVSHEHAYVF
jgi:hypothetical protein